jgi:predicted helicase
VWQVLQALRAHDDRFNAMVNRIDLNKKRDDKIKIIDVPARPRRQQGETSSREGQAALQLSFDSTSGGTRSTPASSPRSASARYWETWAKDVADIAQQHITRITGCSPTGLATVTTEFDTFLTGLRGNLNDGITRADASRCSPST